MQRYQSWTRSELAQDFVECATLFAGLRNVEGDFTFGNRKGRHDDDDVKIVISEVLVLRPSSDREAIKAGFL